MNINYQRVMYRAGQAGEGLTEQQLEQRIAELEQQHRNAEEQIPLLQIALQMKRGEDPSYSWLNAAEAEMLMQAAE